MLFNPHTTNLPTIPGTRMLADSLGLSGCTLQDPFELDRWWTIQWLFAPLPGRALGGVRAKLLDQRGFVTFCNQRDLEVLLGYAAPGARCHWLDDEYPTPGDRDWFGLCCDPEDLLDDLYECELRMRSGSMNPLPSNLEMRRFVHFGDNDDAVELLTLLHDRDPVSGAAPDVRLETLERRWVRVEKTRADWRLVI